MKKFLIALSIVAALFSAETRAGVPTGVVCGGGDTASFSTSPLAVLQHCTFMTGPNGLVFAVATAEVTCGATETVQMLIGTGASPVTGSNFLGQVAGNVLTVNTMILPSSSWPVQVGQVLSGPGFVPVTITGLGTGTGDTGTYTISGAPFTQANENMYGLAPLPGSATAITPLMNQNACVQGFTITSIAGTFAGSPNTEYWLDVTISTSNTSKQSSWNNNGITVLVY